MTTANTEFEADPAEFDQLDEEDQAELVDRFTTDGEGYRSADHAIFTCANCGYNTADLYTAGVINDNTAECPECEAYAAPQTDTPEYGSQVGFGIWCSDDCGWYDSE